jgi:Txe/YoeB family toxin of toxin-antitoxin system
MRQGVALVSWELVFTKQAQKDAKKISAAGLKEKTQTLLMVLRENPFQNPPPYEKLVGDLTGAYSRRITIQHRLVYQVLEEQNVVKVLRIWSHYE